MYIILMNPDENTTAYRGAVCIMDGKPWYVTNLAKPTIFTKEKGADNMAEKLKKGNTDNVFVAIEVDYYLTLVGQDDSCRWLTQMREEQMELMGEPK